MHLGTDADPLECPLECSWSICRISSTTSSVLDLAWHLLPALLMSAGQPELRCKVDVADTLQRDVLSGFAATALALGVFFNAERLSRSTAFRLTSGGLMGVTGAAVIVMLIAIR
jgi:hypothetical protein